MEQWAIEYLANALWQVPALALGAWVLLRMWNPSPAAQHRVWIAVLALGLALPLHGVVGVNQRPASAAGSSAAIHTAALTPSAMGTPEPSFSNATFDAPGEPDGGVQPLQAGGSWLSDAGRGFALLKAATNPHRISVSAVAARWIVGLWLAAAFWGLLRLARAWQLARHLVADSQQVAFGEQESAALRDCARRLGVAPPSVRESGGIAGPVVVGSFAPVLLWPRGMARCSEDERRAALCHELAHIRRRDYTINLLSEAAAVPLQWHPAIHGVARRIRATREMACDAMAAEAMESEAVYTECLVRLAQSIVRGGLAAEPAGAGLFNGNVMEERVMRLMRGRTAMRMRARVVRGAAGVAAMVAAIALAAVFHVVPAMAQAVAPMPPALPATPPAPAALKPSAPLKPRAPLPPPAPPALAQTGPPASLATPPAPPTPAAPKIRARPAVPKVPAKPPVPKIAVRPSPGPGQAVILDQRERDLTPAERARLEKQLDEAQKRIAEARAKINSPEFRKQLEEAQQKIFQAQSTLNSAEIQKKMADARKQMDEMMAKMNSPENRKKIQSEIDAIASNAKFQKAISNAQDAALRAQARKQVDEMMAKMNSPENREKIQSEIDAMAKWNSAEFQKQMAEADKQMANAFARIEAEQNKQPKK